MAQYTLSPNQVARDFLNNSISERYEHLILFRNSQDNLRFQSQDRFYLGAYVLENGNFRNIDLEPGNNTLGTLTENCLELSLYSHQQNVFTDPPEFDLVYFPRNEIARLVNMQMSRTTRDRRIFFTHSRVDYLKQHGHNHPKGAHVANEPYQSMSVLLTSGTPDDPINHAVATSIVQGIPCPPMWDEGKARFVELIKKNSVTGVKVISCEKLIGKKI